MVNWSFYCIFLQRSWRTIVGFVVPFVLIPFLMDYENKANLCAYVLLLMILYWMFEPINLYMTALLPVALFPLLGITTTDNVCIQYMKATNMMFFGGLIMGIALEHCNLHRRIALKVIIFFGSSLKNLMAGIMLVTMFLSMWINNTATTAMMIPIVDSILVEICDASMEKDVVDYVHESEEPSTNCAIDNNNNHNNQTITITKEAATIVDRQRSESITADKNSNMKNLRKALILSIAYSSNIGGTATLTGTGTNLVLQEVFHSIFPESTELTFTMWFIYAFPSALVTIMSAWLLLYIFFLRTYKESSDTGYKIRKTATKKYQELGSLSFHEIGVLIHFVILVLLWFFRQPEIFPGWAGLLTDDKNQIKDAAPAILIAISMFLFPANLRQYVKNDGQDIQRLLNWKVVQKNITWGVVFLLGGGFALSYGTTESKLSDLLSDQLSKVTLAPVLTTIVLVVISATVTEMASNVATANVVLPVISRLAVHMEVNPLMFLVPVTIAISFAFMFPVATPPNAIVFEYLKMDVIDMVKPGFFMNILAVTVQLLFINSLGRLVFNLDEFPSWAHIDTMHNVQQKMLFNSTM